MYKKNFLKNMILSKKVISESKHRENKSSQTDEKQVSWFHISQKWSGMESQTNQRKEKETEEEAERIFEKRESCSKTPCSHN